MAAQIPALAAIPPKQDEKQTALDSLAALANPESMKNLTADELRGIILGVAEEQKKLSPTTTTQQQTKKSISPRLEESLKGLSEEARQEVMSALEKNENMAKNLQQHMYSRFDNALGELVKLGGKNEKDPVVIQQRDALKRNFDTYKASMANVDPSNPIVAETVGLVDGIVAYAHKASTAQKQQLRGQYGESVAEIQANKLRKLAKIPDIAPPVQQNASAPPAQTIRYGSPEFVDAIAKRLNSIQSTNQPSGATFAQSGQFGDVHQLPKEKL